MGSATCLSSNMPPWRHTQPVQTQYSPRAAADCSSLLSRADLRLFAPERPDTATSKRSIDLSVLEWPTKGGLLPHRQIGKPDTASAARGCGSGCTGDLVGSARPTLLLSSSPSCKRRLTAARSPALAASCRIAGLLCCRQEQLTRQASGEAQAETP